MSIDPDPTQRRSLRRGVAIAFAPLTLVVVAAAVCQIVLRQTVHHDVRRLFEEQREVSLVRNLVDELHGIDQWVDNAPKATPANDALPFADVQQHLQHATATLRRFPVADDPSSQDHDHTETVLLEDIDTGLREVAAAIGRGASLGELANPLAGAMHAAQTLATLIENESATIGDELDRGSDGMTQFLLALGLVSLATVGGLGYWLLRRVLRPVQALRAAAVRLGQGELDTAVPRYHDDELGDLAATLATMAARLRESRHELEARVEARSREVLRSARLAQLGTLAAGIAHEINNPLASIVAGSEGLLREAERGNGSVGAGTREYLQILHKEAMRARDITTRLLRFAHQDAPRREPMQLSDEAREVAALFAHQLHSADVRLVLSEDPTRTPMLGDPAEWRQVLFNLLRNALDASPRGGSIQLTIHAEDAHVCLTVRDEGPGIPVATQDRIFEPFFTTKEPGKGTGLGLAIVHRIVEAHEGRIEVASPPPGAARGASFTLRVPAAR